MTGPSHHQIYRHDNVFYLPQAQSEAGCRGLQTALAQADLLFTDLSYAMAARLSPHAAIRKLHPTALLDLAPARLGHGEMKIACELFGAEIDGFEMVLLLNRIGFRGQLIISRPRLPDPEKIRAELADLAQGYRLRLIREHWLGGATPDWRRDRPLERAQRLGKAARIGAVPRR